MTMRPALTTGLPVAEFVDNYWLREELAVFCRANGLSTAGGKRELHERIAAFLGGKPQPAVRRRAAGGPMPSHFTLATAVGQGWRCSQALRVFISGEIGRQFRFDRFMREQIGSGSGIPLGDLIEAWRRQEGRRHEIEPQFEYNRFVQRFRALKPGGAHAEVVAAWLRFRSMPASLRPSIEEFVQAA